MCSSNLEMNIQGLRFRDPTEILQQIDHWEDLTKIP